MVVKTHIICHVYILCYTMYSTSNCTFSIVQHIKNHYSEVSTEYIYLKT
jgi:hypothetical protein